MRSLLLLLFLASPLPAQPPDWFFAQLGDSQWMTYGLTAPPSFPHFANMTWQMTRWNPAPRYVAHVGDLTQNGTPEEFQRGRWAMRLLGDIPWGVCIGNHDYRCGLSSIPSYACAAEWRRWMGPENFVNYVDTPEGTVMFLHLEWDPRDLESLEFARSKLEANPGYPVVLVMHRFLSRPLGTPSGGYYTSGFVEVGGSRLDGAGVNSPHDVWMKLVEPYPQVFMVINGHGYNIVRDTKTTRFGREVQLHCFNLQDDPWGGAGYVRLYRFVGRAMIGYTFSTSAQWPQFQHYGINRTDWFSITLQHSVAEIAAEPPVWHAAPAEDTYIFPFWGGTSTRGSNNTISVSRGSIGEHGLIRFDLTGAPAVTQAVLTFTAEGNRAEGDGFTMHRMLRPWSELDSWNTLGGLVAGVDYEAVPDLTFGAHGMGTFNVDVTRPIADWQAGAPNYGWCLVGGANETKIRTRDWHASTERPLLSIR